MTFPKFESIVKQKHPQAVIFKHGEMAGNKINVAVTFTPNGKVYQYNGTYCEVLNKLGVEAMYKHNYDAIVAALKDCKERNGKQGFFGVIDCTAQIERLEEELRRAEQCVIV